jgi:hypothetical protein
MSFAQLKDEAAQLPKDQRRELIAFLVAQQTAEDEDLQRTLAEKIDDNDPSHWIELDELKKRFAE